MSEHIHKSHNKSLFLYHLVCPIKYRRKVLTAEVSQTLRNICLEISARYEVHFLEIGCDEDHVHFLIQSVPMMSAKKISNTIKSLIAREIFRLHPEIKRFLWGGKFWTSGYYINTVGQYANEEVIKKYVQGQGNSQSYEKIHTSQLKLF
ncbi:IS200/IS605 family transposase [Sabulilitoribacter arenilitoris]|uniref:IS200/IS605 family transposase n=1 Tax=Wocania arenilitoris TaxID=2044858 RepID=A0AAE3JL12_9FLAO|nr:IS200/IS605 family transposase [Wocania arenilitoris]MCF7568733.1 IS200/IS605 family transposase [Wocania arenilitoris]